MNKKFRIMELEREVLRLREAQSQWFRETSEIKMMVKCGHRDARFEEKFKLVSMDSCPAFYAKVCNNCDKVLECYKSEGDFVDARAKYYRDKREEYYK